MTKIVRQSLLDRTILLAPAFVYYAFIPLLNALFRENFISMIQLDKKWMCVLPYALLLFEYENWISLIQINLMSKQLFTDTNLFAFKMQWPMVA